MSAGMWVLIAVLAVVFLFLLPTQIMSRVIYTVLLVRTKKEKWNRTCSLPDDEEYVRMYKEGLDWGEKHAACKQPVDVTSDGLHLAGEYFDFGGDKAVLIIAGRMEACPYSYYFAEPYRASGYNVLVIDNRAHGLSDGKRCSLGYKEYRDILAWADMLHTRFGNRQVVLHGICIGASTALFALTADTCPDYLCGMVADGMYVSFYESFRNHMVLDHRPLFPFLQFVMLHIRVLSGANVVTDGPLKRIGKLRKPILFLHSREDVFSVPEKAQVLYDACNCQKKLVWFDKGAHSRIRINDQPAYDAAVAAFLADTRFMPDAE